MASSDVRDVLNLPDAHDSRSRKSKKAKSTAPRQNLKGLAREVQNLNIGGDNPIALVPEIPTFRKRRLLAKKPAAQWEFRPFRNSGRDDHSLILRHWCRKTSKPPVVDTNVNTNANADVNTDINNNTDTDTSTNVKADDVDIADAPAKVEYEDRSLAEAPQSNQEEEAELEDSAFSKYNVKIPIPKYTDDQYRLLLENSDWSREETDYLMEVVEDFELRWPLIWDRYEYLPSAVNGVTAADGTEAKVFIPRAKPRSMEDLKARYYEVAAHLMAAQKPVQFMSQQEFDLHERMANFNAAWERNRKEFVARTMSRTKEEAREEEMLLLELRRLVARNDQFNEERRELAQRLDYPHTDQDISSFKSSQGLANLLQTMLHEKTRKRKSTNGGGPDTASPQSGALQPLSAAHESTGRRDSVANSARDSIAPVQTPTSATARKGIGGPPPLQERRKLTAVEEAAYGVSHHDRLSAGPTFRTERINKLMLHKSNTQLQRTLNILAELGQPSKLTMPTSAVTAAYEKLLGAIGTLLDARKVSDKLDAEIRLERAKKAARVADYGEAKKTTAAGSESQWNSNNNKPVERAAMVVAMATATTTPMTTAAAAAAMPEEAKETTRRTAATAAEEEPQTDYNSSGDGDDADTPAQAELTAASREEAMATTASRPDEGTWDGDAAPKVKFKGDMDELVVDEAAGVADAGTLGRKRSGSFLGTGNDKSSKRLKQ